MCILCSIICAHYLLPNNLCKRFFLEIKLRFGLGVCIFFFFMRFALCRGPLLLFTCRAVLFTHCNTIVYAFKNIKNEFYGTIHIFKTYFATIFSIFQFLISVKISCIQTEPKERRQNVGYHKIV